MSLCRSHDQRALLFRFAANERRGNLPRLGSMSIGRPCTAGLEFGPTPSGKMYLSRNDHRCFSTDSRRGHWADDFPPLDEFELFAQADAADWQDSRPHLWGIRRGLVALGKDNERIALFRCPSNAPHPWHGYPVTATAPGRELAHRPEPPLVRRWVESGLIDAFQAGRVNRGRV